MKNKLEQIFWRNGKFVNTKNKEVDPKESGKTHIVSLNYPFIEEEIQIKLENIIKNKNYSSEINSYMICSGIEACYSLINEPHLIYVSLEFCKI
jgi:hypothetical protein